MINNYLHGENDCHIIGSGSSLKGFDFSYFDNKFTLAINHSIEHYDASALIFSDRNFIKHTTFDLINYEGLIFCSTSAMIYQPIYKMLNENRKNLFIFTKNEKCVSINFEDGLFHPCSTGWLALNLALIMNARKIFLYGYDYCGERFFKNYEHHNYDRSNMESKKVFQKYFEPFKDKIINCSNKSKLTVFNRD